MAVNTDTPNTIQKLLGCGCRLTSPAVKQQLVPDPGLLLRTNMKAEQNETKKQTHTPDVTKQEDCRAVTLEGWGPRDSKERREVTVTAEA